MVATLIGQDLDNYDEEWVEVYKLELQGLSRSADSLVSEIYKTATIENNEPQVVKSLIYQSKFLLITEEDAELKLINRLIEEAAQRVAPARNVLQSILADLLNKYYERHRYQYYSRTQTAEKINKTDFRTWDHGTMIAEIHKYYQLSLLEEQLLQQTDLAVYSEILDEFGGSKFVRPTLFDFLAHRALGFYKSSDPYSTDPVDNFTIDDPSLISNNEVFIQEQISSSDSLSFELNALNLYQRLTTFHLEDTNPEPLVLLSIERLAFIHSKAIFDRKEELYLTSLQSLREIYKEYEVAAEVDYVIAMYLYRQAQDYQNEPKENRWKAKEALDICQRAIVQYPTSEGATKCKELAHKIQSPTIHILTEAFVSRSYDSKVLVNYKNIEQLYFSVYELDIEHPENFQQIKNDSIRRTEIQKLQKIHQWTVSLRNEDDYQEHSSEVVIPKLETGQYIIVASTNLNLNNESTYGVGHVQATDIVLITDEEKGASKFQVVDRNNGRPLNDATIHLSNKRSRYAQNTIDKTLTTYRNGMASFYPTQYYNDVTITVDYKNDLAVFKNTYVSKSYRNTYEERDVAQIFLFADRSIYRPGQTVYFKGIAMMKSQNISKVITNELITVDLDDVNGQTVFSLDITTNEYGSISGSFVLPSGGLTGQFSLNAYFDDLEEDEEGGHLLLSVEEYKRPRFETSFDVVSESYQLNDTIELSGLAQSFAGSKVTGATVSYKVTRTARFPRWYYYYRPYSSSPSQEITNGEVLTDDEGQFKIKFRAHPDPSVDPEGQPVFTYLITADVTDINGETRSTSTSVKVGYSAIEIQAVVKNQISKESMNHRIQLSTNNLNGSFVPTEGIVKIYKLEAPERVTRQRPWNAPDFPIIEKNVFIKKFPFEKWTTEETIADRPLGQLIAEYAVDTDQRKEIEIGSVKSWEDGKYKLIFEAKDKYGHAVKDEHVITIYDPKAKKVADAEVVTIRTDKTSYVSGDDIQLTVGTAAKDLSVTLVILRNKEHYKTHVVRLKNNVKTIRIPVKEKDRGGIIVYYRYVYQNSFQNGVLPISVPYPAHELNIETMTFRDKLRPGEEETWSFKLSGPKGEVVAAEVLASMYDRSLDEFTPHQWGFSPVKYHFLYGSSQANASFSVRNNNFSFYQMKNQGRINPRARQYDRLNWFGLDMNNRRSSYSYLRKLREEFFVSNNNGDMISGVVWDPDGIPLIGASVTIKGSNIGTITDIDGSYSIAGKPGDILVVSYMGYSNSEITVQKAVNDYAILIEEDADILLDQVVVTGYARHSKEGQMRGASSEFAEAEMLSGAVAGIAVQDQDGNSFNGDTNDQSDIEETANELQSIAVRKNLVETAFFYPHLTTDSTGQINFSFSTPESLTSWKVQLLGHTKDAMSGVDVHTVVTQKELMVIPNPPRFLREGDLITIQTKIASLSEKDLSGDCELQLFDGLTEQRIDGLLKNDRPIKSFSISAHGNTEISWELTLPMNVQAVKYRIVAKAGDFSDGEENVLPVLSNRMLVTETLPMWLRSKQSKTFTLDKLKNNQSSTLQHHKLTLEVTSNPAWYAIQALPYLMEYPYECAEQTFARLYANALGSHIATSQPRIKAVFDQWASADLLVSNLEKNQELKSLIIEETPWLRDAQSESEQKKRISLLFDLNRMADQSTATIAKLKKMQKSNGGFSWFEGGRYVSSFITQHILTGLGQLDHLGIDLKNDQLNQIKRTALRYVDQEALKRYKLLVEHAINLGGQMQSDSLAREAKQAYLDGYLPGHDIIQYLYLRSFYATKMTEEVREAVSYFTKQSYKAWLKQNLSSQGMIALIAHRNDDQAVSKAVLEMLRQNAVNNDELGMYWKSNLPSYHWFTAPIETHALMIEAFSEIAKDRKVVDELRVWLLKNKQTTSWKTTKQTTAAVYALLLQGTEWLANSELVDIRIASEKIDPMNLENTKVEAGTGYFKTSWDGTEIVRDQATVTLSKESDGIAWGGLYWQYFEDLDKITTAKTPLEVSKKLFIKTNTNSGELLTEINEDSVTEIGDLVRVRIELKVDREMEFVHMKDMRAAGLEPIDVLSRYQYQDGLYYYQSTKDAATNFFFDLIMPGVYVFEYDLRVNNKGDFSNGITTIQCMYAPEFSSHSEGVRLRVE